MLAGLPLNKVTHWAPSTQSAYAIAGTVLILAEPFRSPFRLNAIADVDPEGFTPR